MDFNNSNYSESNESNNKADNHSTNYDKFIKNFIDTEREKTDNDSKFLRDIMDADSFSSNDIGKKIDKFKAGSEEYSQKYADYKDHVNIEHLKNYVVRDFSALENTRNNLIEKSGFDYILDDKQKETLKKDLEAKDLTVSEINKILNDEKKLNKYLNDLFGDKLVSRNFRDIFPNLSDVEIEKREKNLTLDEYKELCEIKSRLTSLTLSGENFKKLFEISYLTKDEKINLLKNLVPSINFNKALELGFIDKKYTTKIIEKKSKEIVDRYFGTNPRYLKKVEEAFSKNDLNISIEELLTFTSLDNFVENYDFLCLEKSFNKVKEEIELQEEKEGPQSLDGIKDFLLKNNIVSPEKLKNFKKKSILKLDFTKDGNTRTQYVRIDEFDEQNKEFKLNIVGSKEPDEEKILFNKKGIKSFNLKYSQFISYFSGDKVKTDLDIFSSIGFDKHIDNLDDTLLEVNNLESIDESMIDTEQKRKELKELYIEKKSRELSGLENEKSKLEDQKLDTTKSEKDKEKLDEQIKGINFQIDQLNDEINDSKNDEIDIDEKLVSNYNFTEFLKGIDFLDPEGAKYGFKHGTIIRFGQFCFEVGSISKESKTIELFDSRGNKISDIGYTEFYNEFKKYKDDKNVKKVTREEKVNTFEEIFTDGELDGYKVENGDLFHKDVELNGKKEDKKVDYFVSKRGDLIKVNSIEGSYVDITFGELSEKENKDKKTKTNKIKLENSSLKLSFNEFKNYIEGEEYSPEWEIGKNFDIDPSKEGGNDIQGSFMTRFWNRASIAEVFMGGKQFLDGVEEYLKKGNSYKSAQIALKFSKILPGELRDDFKTQIEVKENEEMDKELGNLGKIGSADATLRIKKWLLDKDTPQHKKEAGLMYMSKYGILYAKAMADYNGTFLWYEALGGTVGDELYMKEKKKAEKAGLPFDEKELLIGLLGAQSKGKLKPHRRSKFFKEFKGKIAGGFQDEYGDGHNDAKDKRRIEDINDGGFGEIDGGTIPNALGWAKRACEKGGDLHDMNELYFSLIFSGALYNAPGKVIETLKDHYVNEGNGAMFAFFGSTLSGQKLFNKTVVDLSEEFKNTGDKKYASMHSEALELFNDANDVGKDYVEKTIRARKFWKKYGKALARTMYMVDSDEEEFEKTDKILVLGRKGKYKKYFETVRAGTDQSVSKADFLNDALGYTGVTGMDTYNFTREYFKVNASRTFADPKLVNVLWKKNIWPDITGVAKKIESDPAHKEEYTDYLHEKLRDAVSGLLMSAGKSLYKALANSDPVGLDLKSIGIDVGVFEEDKIDDIREGKIKKKIFDNAVNKLLGNNLDDTSSLNSEPVYELKDAVADKVKDNIENDNNLD